MTDPAKWISPKEVGSQ